MIIILITQVISNKDIIFIKLDVTFYTPIVI